MRLFVAVDPPAAAREHLTARLHDLSPHDLSPHDPSPHDLSLRNPSLRDPSLHDLYGRLRWTPPEQWHVTLAFLADVTESEVTGLSANLARTAQAFAGFPASLAGACAFPRPARATTLWCGIDPGGTQFSAVAAAVAPAVRAAGLSLDDRGFRPHLTLARCPPTDLRQVVEILGTYRGPRFAVREITLVRSHLGKGPGGRAAHEVIGRWPLSVDRA